MNQPLVTLKAKNPSSQSTRRITKIVQTMASPFLMSRARSSFRKLELSFTKGPLRGPQILNLEP